MSTDRDMDGRIPIPSEADFQSAKFLVDVISMPGHSVTLVEAIANAMAQAREEERENALTVAATVIHALGDRYDAASTQAGCYAAAEKAIRALISPPQEEAT